MNPGLTVRSKRSIRRASGGRSTECPISAIILSLTRISAGPVRLSETPSNTLPQTRTSAFIAQPSLLIHPWARRERVAADNLAHAAGESCAWSRRAGLVLVLLTADVSLRHWGHRQPPG